MNLVEIDGLSFRRRHGGSLILDDVALELAAGEVLCVLGPNGAGKSTLIGCLLGLIEGCGGTILLAGRDIKTMTRREIAKLAAYVPQSSESAFAVSVREMVLMGRTPHFGNFGAPSAADRRYADLALESVSIAHLRGRFFTELSGGEQQLVLLARALAQDTPIIVMDEPTAGLDLGNQGRVLSLIRNLSRKGRAVIMTTHVPDQAFVLDCRVALMKAGRILACGSTATTCCETAMNSLYEARLRKLSDPTCNNGLAAFVADLGQPEFPE